jgi:molecular chaperone DnaK (HSP70)
MSEFGDDTFDQRILDWIKMEMREQGKTEMDAARVLARILHMWLREQTGHDY